MQNRIFVTLRTLSNTSGVILAVLSLLHPESTTMMGDTVTFHYNRHEDNKYIEETLPAIDFIKRLIRHIPEKHFKMIRYGGLYARHREIDKTLFRAISKNKHRIYRNFNQWRTAILLSFGYDPLECPDCKHKMVLLELYYKHKRVPLEELYEKVMSNSLGKRSSA